MSAERLPLIVYDLDDFTEPWREPKAEVVLLHHGLAGTGLLYRPWVPILGDQYRVLRIDNRGQGRTPRPEGYTFSLDGMVKNVTDLLDHLEIERVHWVGASGGGIMGQHAAITRPERIASLSLIATTARFSGHSDNFDEWLEPLNRGDRRGFLLADEEHRFGKDNPARTNWILDQLDLTPAPTVAELHRWIQTINLIPQLGQIQCPTLIVTGERDTLTDLDDAEIMRRGIPNARLEVVKGLPHNIAYTHPHLVARIVRTFLDEIA